MTARDPESIDRAAEVARRYLPSNDDLMSKLRSPHVRAMEAARQRWQENCAGVDEVIQTLATSLNAEYPSGEEYPDARVFSWTEGPIDRPIGYSIRMQLISSMRDTVLRVYSATWIDDETKGVRRSVTPYHVDLTTPVRPRVLQGTLDGLLSDLFDSSPALIRQTAVNHSVPIVETPLSNPPGQP